MEIQTHKENIWLKVFHISFVVCEWILLSLLLGICLLALLPILPTKQYIQTYIVPTGSMTPTIQVGSLAFTTSVLPQQLFLHDIIAFTDPKDKQKTIVHRIIDAEYVHNELVLKTKGDNNNASDPWVVPEPLVHGKFLFALPYVGYLMSFLKTKLGFFLFIGIPSILLIAFEFKHIKDGIDEEVQRRTNQKMRQEYFPKYFILLFFVLTALPLLRTQAYAQGEYIVQKKLGVIAVVVQNFDELQLYIKRNVYSLQFDLTNVSQYKQIDYTIIYDTATVTQEIQGSAPLHNQNEYQSPQLFFGTCSSGACIADRNVHNIHIVITLKNENTLKTLSQSSR